MSKMRITKIFIALFAMAITTVAIAKLQAFSDETRGAFIKDSDGKFKFLCPHEKALIKCVCECGANE